MVNPIHYFSRKADLSTRYLRLNMIGGAMLYLFFGLLDPYAMPISYHKAWCIRCNFFILLAVLALFSFKRTLRKETHSRLLLMMAYGGSLGMFLIVLLSTPEEYAYLHYPMGQPIMIVWAMTAFRLRVKDMVLYTLAVFAGFIGITVGVQGLHTYPPSSPEFVSFLTSLFFMIGVISLAIFGSWRYNTFALRIKIKREQLQAEKQKLRRAYNKIEESDRLKSAFLANMSHEIRTPMHAVLGFSQLLRRPDLSPDKQKKFIDLIESKGHQLLSLIDNILDLSRIDAQMVELEPKFFAVSEIFNNLQGQMLSSMLIRHGRDSLQVTFDCPVESPVIYADYNRLCLVLFHLLDNAVKFTAHGSVLCSYCNECNQHIFRITDTGVGIPADKQQFVFERFTQTSDELNRTHCGTGLGLSIVSGLLKLMDGQIKLESKEGSGSVFTVIVPECTQQDAVAKFRPQRSGSFGGWSFR